MCRRIWILVHILNKFKIILVPNSRFQDPFFTWYTTWLVSQIIQPNQRRYNYTNVYISWVTNLCCHSSKLIFAIIWSNEKKMVIVRSICYCGLNVISICILDICLPTRIVAHSNKLKHLLLNKFFFLYGCICRKSIPMYLNNNFFSCLEIHMRLIPCLQILSQTYSILE